MAEGVQALGKALVDIGAARRGHQQRGGLGGVSGLVITMAFKIWYWMELQRNALTREIKRLELQVAHLAGQMRGRAER